MPSVIIDINSLPPKMVNEDGIHPLSRSLAVSTKDFSNKRDRLRFPKPPAKPKSDGRSRRASLVSEERATSTRNLLRQVKSMPEGSSRGRSLIPPPPQRKGRIIAGGLRRKSTYKKEDSDLSSSTNSTTSTVSTSSFMSSTRKRSSKRASYPKVNIPAVAPGPSILRKQPTTTSLTSPAVNSSESMSSETSTRQRMALSVSFDIVEIHEHAMILDEGNCDGPAMLTIDWEPQSTEVATVQEYYLERSYEREKREYLNEGQMKPLQPNERAAILIRAGSNDILMFLAKSLASTNFFEVKEPECARMTAKNVTRTSHPKKKRTVMSIMKKKKAKQVVKGGHGSK